jgi:hypothetical protein
LASFPKRLLCLGAAGLCLALARPAAAGCTIPAPEDRDGNGSLDLRLTGDAGRQIAVVELNSNGSFQATIDCNHDGDLLDTQDVTLAGAGPIESVFVELAGNDEVTVRQTGDLSGTARNVILVSGSNGSAFSYDTQGHGILAHTRLGIEVIGGNRADSFSLDLGGSTINASSLVVRAELGPQNDAFAMVGAAQVTDSVLDVSVDLGTGGNDVSIADGGGTATGSDLILDLQGGEDGVNADLVDLVLSGRYEGGTRGVYDFPLGDGNDVFTGRVLTPGFGVDTLGAAGSRVALRLPLAQGVDQALLQTEGGGVTTVNGSVDVDIDTSAQRDELFVDWTGLTGTGTLRLRGAGGDASDVVVGSVVTEPGAQNDVDVIMSGNAELDFVFEGDTVYAAVVDLGNSSFGPGNVVVVNGGIDGDDFCSYFGNAPHAAVACEAGS